MKNLTQFLRVPERLVSYALSLARKQQSHHLPGGAPFPPSFPFSYGCRFGTKTVSDFRGRRGAGLDRPVGRIVVRTGDVATPIVGCRLGEHVSCASLMSLQSRFT